MSTPSRVVAIAVLLVTTTIAGPSSVAAEPNEAPLADAGLDQDVTKGATVFLDGTGSRDPDGRIEGYQWSIRTPNDETITPECRDCGRTSFTPTEVGEYRVTLTVTDDDGATKSDTLYVEVSPGTPPTISLSGPDQPTAGTARNYTAAFDAGTADLAHVVWSVGGVVVANHSLSARQAADTATKRFGTAGDRTLTATVYDADGQSSSDSLSVAVQAEPDSPTTTPLLADLHSPTVTGDALVTGERPLHGDYEIRLSASPLVVTAVRWYTTGGRITRGHSLARDWDPGNHTLYAVVTYEDGSQNVATFADGRTTVVADPEPNVSLTDLDRYSAITGSGSGHDAYGNLDSLHVEVDGETVARARTTLRGRTRLDAGRQRLLHFSHDDFTPGERATVTVVATDDRGQTATVRRDVVPVKRPEIVRSEFVTDSVDSYHPRLDPRRYAAHHVLEIDLNGVDPENVSVTIRGEDKKVRKIDEGKHNTNKYFNSGRGKITINTFWAGREPENHTIKILSKTNFEELNWRGRLEDTFTVTPSKPELRLDVLNDGTKEYATREHGILVNASGSFDPDGTDLKYIWKYGAEPTKPDNTTAKFRAYERAASIVEDEYQLQTMREFDFLAYFLPEITTSEVVTDGPYFPNETVRVRVETSAYHFSKQTYYDDFGLDIDGSSPGTTVRKWRQMEATNSGHSDTTEDAYRYVGIVEIPASELSPTSDAPTITVSNADNDRKATTVDVPDVNVLLKDEQYWTNASIDNLTYTLEKPTMRDVTATSEAERDSYLENGYSVETRQQATEYALEQRVKVEDAEYQTVTKTFDSETVRDLYLDSHSAWSSWGTTKENVTRTETNTEWYNATTVNATPRWHDSNRSNGEVTGESREILLEEAAYQTQHQYQYETEVETTETTEVERERTVTTTKTKTRTVTECTVRFGCYQTTEEYTEEVTETYTYTITRTYTTTETETETYWAASSLESTHERTGKTRHVKMDDAVYGTQRQIEQKEQVTETVTKYRVAREELAHPAQYEWKQTQTTDDLVLARQTTASDEWRIGEELTNTTWTLTKRNGTVRLQTSHYANESYVVATSATVEGEVVERYYNVETRETVSQSVGSRSKQYTSDDAKDRDEIRAEVTAPHDDSECKLKSLC